MQFMLLNDVDRTSETLRHCATRAGAWRTADQSLEGWKYTTGLPRQRRPGHITSNLYAQPSVGCGIPRVLSLYCLPPWRHV